MLPTHFEAMADEVGVEIARTVRATTRALLFETVCLCVVEMGSYMTPIYSSSIAALNRAPLLPRTVIVCCHTGVAAFCATGGAALCFGQPALTPLGVPPLRRAIGRWSSHHPRSF